MAFFILPVFTFASVGINLGVGLLFDERTKIILGSLLSGTVGYLVLRRAILSNILDNGQRTNYLLGVLLSQRNHQ